MIDFYSEFLQSIYSQTLLYLFLLCVIIIVFTTIVSKLIMRRRKDKIAFIIIVSFMVGAFYCLGGITYDLFTARDLDMNVNIAVISFVEVIVCVPFACLIYLHFLGTRINFIKVELILFFILLITCYLTFHSCLEYYKIIYM